MNREKYYEKFLLEELENFYLKNEINIPKIEFAITTKCTLKCKFCSNLMPYFTPKDHIDLDFNSFKKDFDTIANNVNTLRVLKILGGEPLINKELPLMIDYAAKNEKLKIIEIVSNGTLLPNQELIDTIKKYDKVYFYLSNYSKNEKLKSVLKYDDIMNLLKNNNIKYQFASDLMWVEEEPPKKHNYKPAQVKSMFKHCCNASCSSILNGKIHVCARSSSGYELGIIKISENDFLDLRGENGNFKEKLINFYRKDCFDACEYCVRLEKEVMPAEQL
jgi:organic radical activating enzyme